MSADHNRWIVSNHRFVEHRSPEAAEAERQRLQQARGKPFFVYRIKRTVDYREPVKVAVPVETCGQRGGNCQCTSIEECHAVVTQMVGS